MMIFVFIFCAAYLGYCLIAKAVERPMIYHHWKAPKFGTPPSEVQEVFLEKEGVRTSYGWLFPPHVQNEFNKVTIVLFHGNKSIIDSHIRFRRGFQEMGFQLLLPEYPGYGRLGHLQSREKNIVASIKELILSLQKQNLISQNLVYHGFSLGGAMATVMTQQILPKALINESSFTSIRRLARKRLIPPFLVSELLDAESIIPELNIPVLVIGSEKDQTIPVAHARRLGKLMKTGHYLEYVSSHYDTIDLHGKKYWQDLKDFLWSFRDLLLADSLNKKN